jgi:outer membrane biosynthesis protein TonB
MVGKGPVIGSALVHAIALFLAWWTSTASDPLPDFVVYEIELISPAAAELGDPTPPPPEELVIETPFEPVPEPPEETPAVVEEETPDPEPPQPDEPVAPPDVEPLDDPGPATSPNPDPEVETPGEDLNVRMEGIRRDYPEYYNNILRQMARCFRWRGEEDLRATVYFVIDRDGSVSQVDIRESSGSIAFDIEAMGAAECAGSRGRLGPLPETLPFDRFPVVFYFEPRTGR